MDPADRLVGFDAVAEGDKGLEESGLGREHEVVELRRSQERRWRLPADDLALEHTDVPEHVREAARREPVDLRGDVPAAAELRADDDLALTLGLPHEQAGAADVHVDAAPVGVPRDHPVDHLPPLLGIVDPVHLGPRQVEPAAPATVDVDDDLRWREELGQRK